MPRILDHEHLRCSGLVGSTAPGLILGHASTGQLLDPRLDQRESSVPAQLSYLAGSNEPLERDAIRTRIVDDGRGLSAQPASRSKLSGYGVLGMRERAETRGGRFLFREGAGRRGVVVEAVLPMGPMPDGVEAAPLLQVPA